jgi:methyltransferase (TIGR00027 family)
MPAAATSICGGVTCAAALSLGVKQYRQKQTEAKERLLVKDCEAAFPTAQLVAAYRAMDAKSAIPCIGSNIGGGPDVAAETLAGDLGFAFAKDFGGSSEGLVNRTMFFDEHIMKMLDAGCKQLVILAAGLDTRAWRLPRLDESIKIFEVDVPRAMAYKAEKMTTLDLPLSCTRIVVEADLSNPSWTSKLLAAGFQADQTSFFLIEGLLMYLPPGAPQLLFRNASSLMSQGSMIAGDTFVNFLSFMPSSPILEKYGTKWTFDFASKEELSQMLSDVSLKDVEAVPVVNCALKSRQHEHVDQAHADAQRIGTALAALPSWPPQAIEWVRGLVQKGETEQVVREIVADRMGFQGLKDSSPEHKARVCELVLQDGWVGKLEAKVKELPAAPAVSVFRKVYDTVSFMYQMFQARRAKDAYLVYTASKA